MSRSPRFLFKLNSLIIASSSSRNLLVLSDSLAYRVRSIMLGDLFFYLYSSKKSLNPSSYLEVRLIVSINLPQFVCVFMYLLSPMSPRTAIAFSFQPLSASSALFAPPQLGLGEHSSRRNSTEIFMHAMK